MKEVYCLNAGLNPNIWQVLKKWQRLPLFLCLVLLERVELLLYLLFAELSSKCTAN